MLKRGRGRPRKSQPQTNLIDNHEKELSNGAVSSEVSPEFFSIYLPALCSNKMEIPPAFIKDFGGKIPIIVTLKTSSGQSWKVYTTKINEHYFFQRGWPKFVQENSLVNGDFLTFCYAGSSNFDVQVFAINGCVKSTIGAEKLQENVSSEAETPKSDRSYERSSRFKRSRATRSVCIDASFTVVLGKYCTHGGGLNIPTKFCNVYLKKREYGVSRTVTLRMNGDSWPVSLTYGVDRVQFLRENVEKDKVPIIINVTKPSSSEFFKFLLPHHFTSQKFLIPPDFVKHFSRTLPEKIILKDVGGKDWHVGVERTPTGVYITSGWQTFVEDHCLKVGDVLVFKYDGRYSFLVKVFGANGCKRVNLPAKKTVTLVKIKEENVELNETSDERACVTKGDLSYRGSVRAEDSTAVAGVEENGLKRRKANPDLPENCKSFEKTDADVHECAYFVSTPSKSNPYYMPIQSNVTNREDVHFEPEMVMSDDNGKEWPVRVYKLKDGCLYFAKGWNDFRKNNNIGFKDSCKFKFDTERFSNIVDVQVLHDKPDIALLQ